MFSRRTSRVPKGCIEVLYTEYSIWYWDRSTQKIHRLDRRVDPYSRTHEALLADKDNNLLGATKRACRREYDRILSEEHEAEERIDTGDAHG
jgi:hypothetical protein